MPIFVQPVLADFVLLIKVLVFFVIAASSIAKMIYEQKQPEKPQRAPGRRPNLDPMDEPAGRAQAGGQQPQQEIRSEVEEFLRRVGQGEQKQQPRQQPAPQARQNPPRRSQIEMLDDGVGVDNRPRQSHRRPTPPPPPPRRQPTPPPAPPRNLTDIDRDHSVAEYVAEHLNEDQFKVRASHLGEDVAQSDERLEARLHETFDHGLGSLSARRQARELADAATKKQQNEPNMADTLLAMLSTPAGVQQAVILNEVLRRPDDRF